VTGLRARDRGGPAGGHAGPRRGLAAVLAVAAGLEWLAYRERWLPLRWWAAALLDAVAFLIAAVVARPQGLPEGYAPLAPGAAAGALLALPALYVVSLAARTLRRGGW